MESAEEPGRWRQKALTLIGVGVFVVFLAGVGIYTFVMAVSTRLHPNPKDVPSVALAAPSPKWAAAVDQGRLSARAGLVEQNLPGLSVAVGVGGDIVWAEGFGWADMEKRVPVAPGMRFRIGHTSKALTSAGVGLLLEKGRLHLEDEIQTYVPEFPRKQWPVTLRQLMGHVAGIRHYGSEEDDVPTAHCERAADGLKGFADDPLRFEPDTQYRLFDVRLGPGERRGRGGGEGAALIIHGGAGVQAVGHDLHDVRLPDRSDPGSGDLLPAKVHRRRR